jgi:hypothetical protein
VSDVIPIESIANRIILIRGHKVMLDRDLAELYQVETRVLTQAVRRNIKRFPDDFMFVLKDREFSLLMSQSVISKNTGRGGTRKPPMAFTEQGVAMLSSVLKSERAIEVNIAIMRAFVEMRQMLATHKDLKKKIEAMESKYDEQFQVVFEAIRQLLEEDEKPKRKIGF